MTSFARKMARRLYKVKLMTKNEGPYDPAMYFMGPIYSWIIYNWTNIRESPAICIYIYMGFLFHFEPYRYGQSHHSFFLQELEIQTLPSPR